MTSIRLAIADLHPAYFALVMATGIVSIAAKLAGLPLISDGLLWINVVAYAVLWCLTLVRLAWFPHRLFADLIDHHRGVGFFTCVAATGVLGTQIYLLRDNILFAAVLGIVAGVLWLILVYSVFAAFTVKENKPDLAHGLHGGWLLGVVAMQSLAVLCSWLGPRFESCTQPILFTALVFWLGGGMHYVWIISLIFYRYTFFPMSPSDLSPPYWINMGAMAISTLAGATLSAQADAWQLLVTFQPVIKVLSIGFWATATWWIPMLLILGAWRHLYKRLRFRYDPLYWGAVFPLGMYSVCTFRLAAILDANFLQPLAFSFAYIAIAAWIVVFLGLMVRLLKATLAGLWHPSERSTCA
ncbi:MAG: tellurite resistance/C4-dicarboxylate transporter family protein [Pirellulales bacterium]|nr:tellurite resistance/C4-dicarboxylate transporter family protein [Pirellulales bacterium]